MQTTSAQQRVILVLTATPLTIEEWERLEIDHLAFLFIQPTVAILPDRSAIGLGIFHGCFRELQTKR